MQKLIKFLGICMFCLLTIYANSNVVYAEDEIETPVIDIEINDTNAMNAIKHAVIDNSINYELFPFLKDNIDFEKTEMIIDNFDITKIQTLEANVYINIKTINLLQEQKLFNRNIVSKVKLNIIDTIAPQINLTKNSVKIKMGNNFDASAYLANASDNSLEEISEVKIENNVNTDKAGNYEVKYIAFDSSNNVAVATLPVVVEKAKTYTHYGTNQSLINEMLNLINQYRAQNGLAPYALGNSQAQQAMGVRACEAQYSLSHTRPNGSHYKTVFSEYGVNYSGYPYEILTTNGSTPADKLRWWQNSSGHNRFLLEPNSRTIAIGYCGKMWAAMVYNN